ncbi:hypothetical protein AVEN_91648-1 [Araneus ventricosus]|uniref:Uncharacterized protein n=1 Tax=Araneus ventricosus TaxID=182803 RepID=A0A4Y2EVG0_ARAVE|nr:hypothetical protein AVEN_91648-1 [Araneus ventricosus]
MNVLNSTELKQVVNIFRDESVSPDDIDEVGQKVLIVLVSGKNSKELRFKIFQKSLVKNYFILASLPPITAAASEDSYRAYLQVQLWSECATSKGLLANPLQSWG